MLKVGRKWRKLLAHAPLPAEGGRPEAYPLHCGVPIGFAASAACLAAAADVLVDAWKQRRSHASW